MKHFYKKNGNALGSLVLIFLLTNVFVFHQAFGQDRSVSGKVTTAEDGSPLPGVNVLITGTITGTVTDMSGNYNIDVPREASLTFSSVGYLSQTEPVGNRSVINIVLEPDIKQLEEIVVIGYGSVVKSDLTGSIASITKEDMEATPMISLEQGIQGRAPGVQVTQSSHAPGGALSVRVRGANSINSQAEPLYVIDGFPVYSNNDLIPTSGPNDGVLPQMNLLAGLNPGDIERIEILKDASATAIYGARGANGVVLITSKRGKEGAPLVEYSGYYGVQNIANKIEMMNAYEFSTIKNEQLINTGQQPIFTGQYIGGGQESATGAQYHGTPEEYLQGYYTDSLGNQVSLPDTDWQDEILRQGTITNHQLSVSGGNLATKYAVSFNYFNNAGIIKGGDYTRYSLRTNLDLEATNWLDFGASILYSYNISNSSGSEGGMQWFNAGSVSAALKSWPVYSPYDEDGNLNVTGTGTLRGNPVAYVTEAKNEVLNERLLANLYTRFKIAKGLDLKISFGGDLGNVRRNRYFPTSTYQGYLTNGSASRNYNFKRSILNENILSYNTTLGDIHEINAVGGFTIQQEIVDGNSSSAENFPSDVFEDNNMGAGANQTLSTYSAKTKWSLASWLGRINYVLMDRYLFSVTARADGSSKFGSDNKWAFFPSFAVAWRITEENFMQNQNIFSNLKLRTSYGMTGNSEIGLYRSLALMGIQNYTFTEGFKSSGVGPYRMANPDLKWETTDQFDIGIELGFLKNRLSFEIDAYIKKTSDLLLAVNLPGTAGYTPPVFDVPEHLRNVGELENKGMEFSTNFDILVGKFTWNLNGNISFNRNEIVKLTEGGAITLQNEGINKHGGAVFIDEGLPLGVWRYPVIDGLFHNQDEVDAYVNENGDPIQPGAEPGDVRYKDVDGDGDYDGDDLDIIGDPNPDYIFGITNSFGYKNFELTIFINGSQGNDLVAPMFAHAHELSTISNGNLTKEMMNRWTPENQNTDIPKAGANYGWGNNQVFDGSYVRIKNIRLAYNIPTGNITWLRRAQVYFNIQNLYTFTDYIGYDPEVNAAGQTAWQYGIDLNGFPNTRTFLFGATLGL
ncbi:MAG: TonB-dependent receptor [Cyclobacteriaceae bacterium]|nr:TonB-dependent receptor [Cyclobacteriaceae bacterium]